MMVASAEGVQFCNCLDDLNLVQLISKSTHIKGNILDLVITNDPDRISNLSVETNSSVNSSDH